jgi:hypothetical protein
MLRDSGTDRLNQTASSIENKGSGKSQASRARKIKAQSRGGNRAGV